jgi:ribosomal protein S17E
MIINIWVFKFYQLILPQHKKYFIFLGFVKISFLQNIYKFTFYPHIMGRIKTQLIKRTTEELMEKDSQDFTTDFTENKRILDSKLKISSKKMRNVIAGYTTRLKKQESG